MDAQNAAEANATKPSASSSASASRVPSSQRQKPSQSSSSAAPLSKSPSLSRAVPPASRYAKPTNSTAASSSTAALASTKETKGSAARTSSPTATRESRASVSSRERQDDDGGTDGNSEAETIVLSKDGSPAKPRNRKVIKHEDKDKGKDKRNSAIASSSHPDSVTNSRRHVADRKEALGDKREKADKAAGDAIDVASPGAPSALAQAKKKRLHDKLQTGSQTNPRGKDTSSSLSSAPASPPRSRNASSHPHSGSDSDRGQRSKSTKRSSSTASKDRLRPPEKLVPHKRKAPKVESDDEAESRNARRLRLASAGAGGDGASHSSSRLAGKELSRNSLGSTSNGSSGKLASRNHRDTSQNRSISPQPRSHRRSLSTQLQSQSNGLGLKKKRVPAPLQSTDYNSDDSSASGSPHVRSAKPRRLATPATAESAVSPAKIVPHKKHLDAHGQTFLARACARGEFELAKQRLEERPEDLNVADFAGNTPLQIAALNGYGNIVKFLIDAGCNLDCVNYDKDTPLLDAVDNGHLEVVKLLLDAGVNPRKANLHGVEPLERVTDDIDNAIEIRAALVEAKKNIGERRLTSEEHRHEYDETRSSYNPDSPKRSPAPPSSSSRRAATGRATKTSNHLLYMPMDDKTLRLAAGRGDQQDVIRILQVRDTFDDPEAMVAASRGGHDVVLQLLLALGKANPDPPPITSAPPEHATPILAAIGQENIKVVSLLLEQSGFDPTKRFEGDTYYEIARQRQGPNWKEEEDILKKAYDSYKKSHGGKTKSPPRKDAENRRSSRAAENGDEPSSRTQKRKLSSPSQERPKKPTAGSKSTALSTGGASAASREEKSSQKRSSERADGKTATKPRQRADRSPSVSNRDTPPPSKQTKSKKLDSDSIVFSSEGETAKPRRKKLISGRELKDEKVREQEREREKQRRASIVSSKAPTPPKELSSPHEVRLDDATTDKDKARAEKHRDRDRDRARQLKKEGTKNSSNEVAGKRNRLSETPPNSSVSDRDIGEAPVKRRRLEAENGAGKEKRPSKGSAPPDDTPANATITASRDTPAAKAQKRREDEDRKPTSGTKTRKRDASSDRGKKDSLKPVSSPIERSIHVKSEDFDVEMVDVSPGRRASSSVSAGTSAEGEATRHKEEEKKKKAEAKAQLLAAEEKKKEDEAQRRRRQEEEKRKREEEKRRREEEEEAARLKEEEDKKKKKELEEKKKQEEEEKLKQRKRLEEEERKRKEEEEKKKREEEEEKRRQEEAEQKRKREEEERKKREEEERLRQEQLEKEAAEEARRKREEEERKKREREEQARILAEKQAEELRRRQFEEEERVRIGKLPPLLRWLSTCPNPKDASIARQFRTMQSIRYDCIKTDATGTAAGREGWLLNTQVALVLGEKDLSLSQFPSWQRLPASTVAKQAIWHLEADRFSLTDPDLYDLGRQLPGLYGGQDPRKISTPDWLALRNGTRDMFLATEMFFVKASDVLSVVPKYPHLHGVRLVLSYRELPETESQSMPAAPTAKWKNDPDADQHNGFAPGQKYYVDGVFVGQQGIGMAIPYKTPPREVRVPRRGLVAVPYDDPEFATLSKAMGIDPFTFAGYASFVARQQNGASQSPRTVSSYANGNSATSFSAGINGSNGSNGVEPAHPASLHNAQRSQAVNGINGTRGM
ncbi:hypothetical protein SCUCBS95973_001908 [Sporothrix curviconia]|uniref:Ankyrin repeat protein n=1 Tax=Sporothrix curviconia TaxID=1260050 RepID=A0ABP0B2I3_9PEZI